MAAFLLLVPLGVFATLMLVTSAAISLFVAAGLSLAVVGFDVARGGSVKLLSAGSVLLFAAIGGYVAVIDDRWSGEAVRIAVDAGVLAIVLASLAIRAPFSLQYARERVDAETMRQPGFRRANYVITWAWAAAFMLMLLADILTVYAPRLPVWIGFALAFAARNAAVYFTRWYPQYRRAKYAADQNTPPSARS